MNEFIEDLKQTNLFFDMEIQEIDGLLHCLCTKYVRYAKGDYIVEEGERIIRFRNYVIRAWECYKVGSLRQGDYYFSAEKGLVLHERIDCLLRPTVREKVLTYLWLNISTWSAKKRHTPKEVLFFIYGILPSLPFVRVAFL